jgi:hypothetical protein
MAGNSHLTRSTGKSKGAVDSEKRPDKLAITWVSRVRSPSTDTAPLDRLTVSCCFRDSGKLKVAGAVFEEYITGARRYPDQNGNANLPGAVLPSRGTSPEARWRSGNPAMSLSSVHKLHCCLGLCLAPAP